MENDEVTNEKIMSFLVEMDERVTNVGEQIAEVREVMATKEDLETLRQDIMEELRPIVAAVDSDAVTIMDYEKRIVVLERRGGMEVK